MRELGEFRQGDLVKERVAAVNEAGDSALAKEAEELFVFGEVDGALCVVAACERRDGIDVRQLLGVWGAILGGGADGCRRGGPNPLWSNRRHEFEYARNDAGIDESKAGKSVGVPLHFTQSALVSLRLE